MTLVLKEPISAPGVCCQSLAPDKRDCTNSSNLNMWHSSNVCWLGGSELLTDGNIFLLATKSDAASKQTTDRTVDWNYWSDSTGNCVDNFSDDEMWYPIKQNWDDVVWDLSSRK